MDLAQKQLEEGTASAMVITHFLKLGTAQAALELKQKELEMKLIEQKTKSLESSARIEALYAEAMMAMRRYSGSEPGNDFD